MKMLSKKASANMWWIIIGAVIALVVMIILMVMFTGKGTKLESGLSDCEGKGGICIDNTFKCPAGSLESSTAFECKVGKCCIGLPKTCKTDNVAGDCGPVAKWACKPAISGGTKNYCFEK
jgi:hypothetical protein